MRRHKLLFFLILLTIVIAGCDMTTWRQKRLIPRQELSPAQEEAIKKAITAKDRTTLQDIGKPAVPMIIERIFEIYNSKPSGQNPIWAEASNLVLLLGRIGDKSAVPALNHTLVDIRYRIFRGKAAYSLGHIGDKQAVKPLWQAFNQEKSYLAKGDNKGPDYGWGLAGNYTSLVLEEIGMALERLGENSGEYPRPFHGIDEDFM